MKLYAQMWENEQCVGGVLISRTQGFIKVPMMHLAFLVAPHCPVFAHVYLPQLPLVAVDCPKTICTYLIFRGINCTFYQQKR